MPGSKRPRDGDDSQSRLQFGPPRRLFTSEQFETSAPESVLKTVWGYDKFRGKQLQAVQQVVQGYSTIVLFPTGAGKRRRLAGASPTLHPGASSTLSLLQASPSCSR